MNVELLQRVKAHILENPETYDQDVYHCGTRACIAGHALILWGLSPNSLRDIYGEFMLNAAIAALEITDDQAEILFCTDLLVEEIKSGKIDSENPADLAQAAARHIDRFIETNGEEV